MKSALQTHSTLSAPSAGSKNATQPEVAGVPQSIEKCREARRSSMPCMWTIGGIVVANVAGGDSNEAAVDIENVVLGTPIIAHSWQVLAALPGRPIKEKFHRKSATRQSTAATEAA